MDRNQKIALGCGVAGCLGLIVVVIAAVLIYLFAYSRTSSTNRNSNFNITTNRNSNSNDNEDSNANENSASESSRAAASMSEDDKHKLYQAALQTGDPVLVRRVSIKMGLMEDDYTTGDKYQTFVIEHVTWAIRNTDFAQSLDTPEKARAYVDENIPD